MIEPIAYNDVRRRFLVVEHEHDDDRDLDSLSVLLRFPHPAIDEAATRSLLTHVGFSPSASPAATAMSYRMNAIRSEKELVDLADVLCSHLHSSIALSIGSSPATPPRLLLEREARFWPRGAPLIVQVVGTNRCVLLTNHTTDSVALEHAITTARIIYEETDHHPATE